jgi:hypothetical protein
MILHHYHVLLVVWTTNSMFQELCWYQKHVLCDREGSYLLDVPIELSVSSAWKHGP